MKFFHLSDLHIGKQLHRYNLKENQQVILKKLLLMQRITAGCNCNRRRYL